MYNKGVAFADVTQWQSVRFPSRIRGFDSRHLLHKQGNPIYCVYALLKTLYIGLFMFRFILNRSYITLFVTNRVTKILPDRFRLSKACPPFSRGCGASPPAPTGNAVGFLSFRLRRGCGQGLLRGTLAPSRAVLCTGRSNRVSLPAISQKNVAVCLSVSRCSVSWVYQDFFEKGLTFPIFVL